MCEHPEATRECHREVDSLVSLSALCRVADALNFLYTPSLVVGAFIIPLSAELARLPSVPFIADQLPEDALFIDS